MATNKAMDKFSVILLAFFACFSIGQCQLSRFKCEEKNCILSSNPPDGRAQVSGQQGATLYGCATGNTLNIPKYEGVTEVHVLGVYEPVGGTRRFQQMPSTVGKIRVKITNWPGFVSAGRMALILLSYEAVQWEIEDEDVDFIKEIDIYSYYASHSSVVFINQPSESPVVRNHRRYYGYGRRMLQAMPLLRIIQSKYGVLTSLTGTYRTSRWDLHVGARCSSASGGTTPTPVIDNSVTGCISTPESCWIKFNFRVPATWNDCSGGAQYVRTSTYPTDAMFIGVQLCSATRYKLFLSNSLSAEFKHIADGSGHGQDHCEFLDKGLSERRARASSENIFQCPNAEGYYRYRWGQQLQYGRIGALPDWTGKYYTKWYECGVTIPGTARVVEYDGSLNIGIVSKPPTPPPTRPPRRPPTKSTTTTTQATASPLVFRNRPSNKTADVGATITLECNTIQHGLTRWYHNGRQLTAATQNVNVLPGGVLLIPSLDISLYGRYTCLVTAGQHTVTAFAWIKATSPSSHCSVEFTQRPSDVTKRVSEPAFLACSSEVGVMWKKNEVPLRVSNRADIASGRIRILSNGYLLIDNLRPSDDGFYTCVATSSTGCVSEVEARLTVQADLDINSICGRPIVSQPLVNTPKMRRGRIVGGEDAPVGSAPWYVQLYNQEIGGYCGGILVDKQWVVTAAHCVTSFKKRHPRRESMTHLNFFMKLGLYDTKQRQPSEVHMMTVVNGIVLHPGFNTLTFDNDIALIKLETEVTFTEYIVPICLAGMDLQQGNFFGPGGVGVTVGLGRIGEQRTARPRYLKELSLPLVDPAICSNSTNYPTTDNMFCAGYDREVIGDTCAGDSGGPFVMRKDGKWYLVGIVSWGEGCARAGHYGFYTKVGKYYDWIRNRVGTS